VVLVLPAVVVMALQRPAVVPLVLTAAAVVVFALVTGLARDRVVVAHRWFLSFHGGWTAVLGMTAVEDIRTSRHFVSRISVHHSIGAGVIRGSERSNSREELGNRAD
jgi:hypothetical protein